jgi:hypothetical protein
MARLVSPAAERDDRYADEAVPGWPEPLVAPPPPATPALLALQRSAGNQAVAHLLGARRLQRSATDAKMDLEGGGGSEDRKRRREDSAEGGDDTSASVKAVKRERVGDWEKDTDNPNSDRWMHDNKKWHFTYFKPSGDYHLKGNNATVRAYQKGYFSGVFKEDRGNKHKKASAAAISDGQAQYLFCVTNIVPRYHALPTYKGQTF